MRDDKKMIEFYFWICWCGRQAGREGLGFYKTLIRMYPWDIMVIGPGNTSYTHIRILSNTEHVSPAQTSNSVPPPCFPVKYEVQVQEDARRVRGNKSDDPWRPWNFSVNKYLIL